MSQKVLEGLELAEDFCISGIILETSIRNKWHHKPVAVLGKAQNKVKRLDWNLKHQSFTFFNWDQILIDQL